MELGLEHEHPYMGTHMIFSGETRNMLGNEPLDGGLCSECFSVFILSSRSFKFRVHTDFIHLCTLWF